MNLNFDKMDGLLPAVVQDAVTSKVLMVGFMNEEAYNLTESKGMVIFYSRSKQKLNIVGEETGDFLHVVKILPDCDNDTVLIKAKPAGVICGKKKNTCFNEKNTDHLSFLKYLQDLIDQRKKEMPEGSYTTKLFKKGVNKIAKKLGEEAVELVIEAKDRNDELLLNEAADLIYHLLVLLSERKYRIEDVIKVLKARHK